MKCRDCVYLSDEKCQVGRKCVNPEKHWQTRMAMWKYPTTPACKMAVPIEGYEEPKKEVREEVKPMYEIDEATQKIVKRLERASMHMRALDEVEMSYDIDMGALKIKELYAKCASQEALIREKCWDK